MPQMMSNIGGWIGNNTGLLNLGATGAGVLTNFLQGRKQQNLNDQIIQNEQAKQKLLNDPAALAAKLATFRQPLNQGLVSGVGNSVQGYLADRGLSASPSIEAEVMAQALGPYVNQNNNSAMEAMLRSLGIPYAGMAPKFGAPLNLTGVLQSLLKSFPANSASTASSPVDTSSLPMPKGPDQIIPNVLPPPDSATGLADPGSDSSNSFDWSSLWNLVPSGGG